MDDVLHDGAGGTLEPDMCTLEQALGHAAPCPGASCAFWDDAAGACVFEGAMYELLARPEVSAYLTQLRHSLEERSSDEIVSEARSHLSHLLNEDGE
jgi:hypothetical protein